MTAPPRPNLGILRAHAEVGVPGLTRELYETIAYIEHLERRIEQLEATQREARREPDCEQQAEPWGWP